MISYIHLILELLFNPDNPPLNASNGTGIILLYDTMDAFEYIDIFIQSGLFINVELNHAGELNDIFFNPNDPRFNEQWYLKQTSNRDIDAEKAWTNFSGVGFRPDTNKPHASLRVPPAAGRILSPEGIINSCKSSAREEQLVNCEKELLNNLTKECGNEKADFFQSDFSISTLFKSLFSGVPNIQR
ncbi:MAG: hypothetical protein IPG02_01305 [Ignavibacteria bacterium]|nr:hypothetical protein [Ignavibacteria bacterium]